MNQILRDAILQLLIDFSSADFTIVASVCGIKRQNCAFEKRSKYNQQQHCVTVHVHFMCYHLNC